MKSILSAVIGATLALSAMEADAQTAAGELQVALEIKSTTLAEALDLWAARVGLQMFVPPESWETAKKLSAPELNGTFTPQAALEKLLEGTPLTGVWLSDRAVSIRERKQVAPTTFRTIGDESARSQAPIARFADEADTLYVGANNRSPESASEAATSSRRSQHDVTSLEEIVVTGTHIRGVENRTAPVLVLDKKYIESTGLNTVASLVESIPQNFALSNQAGVAVPGVSDPGAQGASINLRGIGEGTTLVLINGHRTALGYAGSAVDISALPLSAIDRVEVLTDGASAIYGSDAIGGVVNFILKSDFDGAETLLETGSAKGGVDEHRISQSLGGSWETGNALVSMEYYKRDLLRASERDFVPSDSLIGSLFPRDENVSGMFSGRQELTDTVGIFADALYTKRKSYNEGGLTLFNDQFHVDNPQFTANGGVDWQVGGDWRVEASGGYASNDTEVVHSSSFDAQTGLGATVADNESVVETGRMQADGPLFQISGGLVRAAIGAEWREESLHFSVGFTNGPMLQDQELSQIVRSAFGELSVPIVGPDNARTGIQRLELSVSARADDYSTFGSSIDPRYGLMWVPLKGLLFRGSYGTSFVAPKLSDHSVAGNAALAFADQFDPASPTGLSEQMQVYGNANENLRAQTSRSWSLGLEFKPVDMPSLQMALNYYNIEYRNRITNPPFADVILANPDSFSSLFIRDPTADQVAEFIAIGELGGLPFVAYDSQGNPDPAFTPDDVDVIVDLRRRNLSVLATSGLDASARYGFDVGGAAITLGLDGTYVFEFEQQTTTVSAPFDTVDTFYNPPSFRLRGSLGTQYGSWSANLFVNHTDSYTDNRLGTHARMDAYTTVDAHLAYDFKRVFPEGVLSGLTAFLSVQNLFDEDPPKAAILESFRDMGFDPTNANPLGRFVGVGLTKVW
jgi:iron complex outermembrane recepter protein